MHIKKVLFLINVIFIYSFHSYADENAGILPYAYKDGTAYFLFGLEDRYWDKKKGLSWTKQPQTRSTWVWNDFGGKCDATDFPGKIHDEGIEYCAARECTEETRYVFGNALPLSPGLTTSSPEFTNSINYLIKNITKKFEIRNRSGNLIYNQFFALVEYIDAEKFTNAPEVPNAEKKRYKWIKVKNVLAMLKTPDKDGFFYRFTFTPTKEEVTNKMFPYLVLTLQQRDVQNFITHEILGKVPKIPDPSVISTLRKDLQTLHQQLKMLNEQLAKI